MPLPPQVRGIRSQLDQARERIVYHKAEHKLTLPGQREAQGERKVARKALATAKKDLRLLRKNLKERTWSIIRVAFHWGRHDDIARSLSQADFRHVEQLQEDLGTTAANFKMSAEWRQRHPTAVMQAYRAWLACHERHKDKRFSLVPLYTHTPRYIKVRLLQPCADASVLVSAAHAAGQSGR